MFRRARSASVDTQPALSHWQKLLREWCRIHERYCRRVPGDAIYWNIERSNLAALAAAAWRSGWVALEEFPQPKRTKRVHFDGRADLFLKSPSSEDYVEAKMSWLTTRVSAAKAVAAIDRDVQRACSDASSLRIAASGGIRVGVVFAVPYIPRQAELSLERFDDFFDAISDAQFDAVAWCFPKCARQLTWDEPRANVHPGVILLAKAVR